MTWWVISVLGLSRGQSKDGTLWKSAGVYKLVAVRRLYDMGAGSVHALLSRAGDFCIIGQAACSYMHAASDELRYLVNRVVTISDVKTMQ